LGVLGSASPLEGVGVMEVSWYKGFAKLELHLPTTENVQFTANKETVIHFHALIVCIPLLECSLG